MEDCNSLELFIEKNSQIKGQSKNSTCSSDSTETPQSCGNIFVFNLHKELIFNCQFCEFKFGDLDNFGRHLQEVHNHLLQNSEPAKENIDNWTNCCRTAKEVKKEPETLVCCGNIFISKERKFAIACGYCDCSKHDNEEMFVKHIKQHHNIFEGAHDHLNVVPKVETIKEEVFIITELEEAKIKEEQPAVEEENESEITDQYSGENEKNGEADEEIESGEESGGLESAEEDEEDGEIGDEDYKPSTSTASKKGAIQKKKQKKEPLENIGAERKKIYNCEYCEKKYRRKEGFINHIRTHTGERPYECDICHQTFIGYNNLREHKTRKHMADAAKTFNCTQCDSKFFRQCNLDIHNRIHTGERPYECDICHQQFRASRYLRQHKIRMHSHDIAGVSGDSAKTNSCEYCAKKFVCNADLKSHIRVHTGEKPYECDICHQSFRIAQSLRDHTKSKHKEDAGQIYNCDYCERQFSFQYELDRHKLTHSTGSASKGELCQQVLGTESHLNNPKMKQLGEAIVYQCQYCDKEFSRNSDLTVHTRGHTGQKVYNCGNCDKEFSRKFTLERHKRKYCPNKYFNVM